MKYIHNGESFLIFSSHEPFSHIEMAHLLKMNVVHAGFVLYEDSKVHAFGKSYSLDLCSRPFELSEKMYAGRNLDRFNYVLVSNDPELLKALGVTEVEPATWHQSQSISEFIPGLPYLDVPNPTSLMSMSAVEA